MTGQTSSSEWTKNSRLVVYKKFKTWYTHPMQEAPLPVYESPRLVGLELEYDSGNAQFREPNPLPLNWVAKHDGSLRNGREFVLEPAVSYNQLMPYVQRFTEEFDQIKIGLTTRGGFHVHVQAHDYTHDDAFNLAKLYTHFQSVIDSLLGQSRVNNRYCPPFPADFTKERLVAEFKLTEPAENRERAKWSRVFRVINFAMMRCSNAQHRSVEFRQGSPSKRFANIYGWSTFVTALTDMARDPGLMILATHSPQSLEGLLEVVKQWQLARCGQNIVEWIQWRYEIMNGQPTDDMISRLVTLLQSGPQGLFSVSTSLDINYPIAKKLLTEAHQRGIITPQGNRYKLCRVIDEVALEDLSLLREAATASGR
jgi:hypothetical protein